MSETCADGGLIVGTQHELPVDPSIHYTGGQPFVGCNRLECGLCGQAVRHFDGHRLEEELRTGPDREALWNARSPADVPHLVRALHPATRFYYCRCWRTETAGASPAAWVSDADWRCGGHP